MTKYKDDISLIKRCLSNDQLAQKALVNKFGPPTYAYISSYVKKTDEAQDLLQEVFISVFQALPSFKGESSLRHWIKTIARNKVFRNAKSRWNKYIDRTAEVEDYQPIELEGIEDELFAEDILKLVDKLPEINRVVFTMHTIDGFSHKEIGDIIGISEEGSRSRLYKARKFLIHKFSQAKINQYE